MTYQTGKRINTCWWEVTAVYSLGTASPGWRHGLSRGISSFGDEFLYVDSLVAANESCVLSLQSTLQLLLMVEGSTRISSTAVRLQMLVFREVFFSISLGRASSSDAARTRESYKRSALGWRAPGSCQLGKTKGMLTCGETASPWSGQICPFHLLPEIPFSRCSSFYTSFIKLASCVRRWKHLFACLAYEGNVHLSAVGDLLRVSASGWM